MKKAYIGRPGSGKTTKLLEDLSALNVSFNINNSSTLAFVIKDDLKNYKEILPNANYYIDDGKDFVHSDVPYNTFVVDTACFNSEMLKSLNANNGICSVPSNILWTSQSVRDLLALLPKDNMVTEKNLLIIEKEIMCNKQCVVVDLEEISAV